MRLVCVAILLCASIISIDAYVRPRFHELNILRGRDDGLKTDSGHDDNDNELNDCICSININPVCGSNGKTYENECLLNCAVNKSPGLKMISKGRCKVTRHTRSAYRSVRHDICVCTWERDPVCDTEGRTHGNSCGFECKQRKNPALKIAYEGRCRKSKFSRYDYYEQEY